MNCGLRGCTPSHGVANFILEMDVSCWCTQDFSAIEYSVCSFHEPFSLQHGSEPLGYNYSAEYMCYDDISG